ncbi:alpha-mannosidase [Microlunatus parietis]|uniref:Alpha-mannosidase n=1 Tax=Microlunatus parietis TaxID=682979 RepID=A0A7Y9LAX4_9ACTN|nr:alpha-mannosidase [Microlunatus parietis]NYE70035.1 alpha-mannosidase [Microlunatus parietis]
MTERPPLSNAPSGDQPRDRPPTPQPLATPDRTLHLIGNSHLDPVWLWPWQEGYQEARATFWSAIHRMEEFDDFVYTCDQIVLLDWVREVDPVLFGKITERVAEGRWVNVGGWWVEPDCNMPMGESFVRQGLYGQRFLIEHFGLPATVGMNVDPFGHAASLPAILRGQGMSAYTFLRPGPHEADLFDTPFWWTAPDGSTVLACRIPYEYCSPPGDVSGQTEKALGQVDRGFDPLMVFYGVGNHGGGPTRANISSIERYHRMGTFGRLLMSSPDRYFDEVRARLEAEPDLELPVRRGDLQHHAPGCYSAHSGIKQWQRRAQHAVLTAERWAIAGDLLGRAGNPALADPRDDLTRAWQQVLFNQFHDVLPGSAIESAYDDARDQLGEAVAISKRIITRVHNALARQVDVPLVEGTQPVLIFNPHPWPVRTLVEINYGVQPLGVHVVDHEERTVPSQRVQSVSTTSDRSRGAVVFSADLPAFGYALHSLRPGPENPAFEPVRVREPDGSTGWVIENARLRAVIDPATGWLSSLLDKESGLDPVAGATGAHLQVCEDPTDTWGHRVVSYAWPGAEPTLTAIKVREDGSVRARLRVERTYDRSVIIEEFVLGHADDQLRVDVEIDWRQQAQLMKLRVPVALTDPRPRYEIPFATLERELNGAEDPAQSWVDLTGRLGRGRNARAAGLTVINNAKHGYDASPADGETSASLGITAVRSAVYSWHDPRLIGEGEIHRFQDQGAQRFSLALVPHAGDWRSVAATRRAAELGQPVRAMLESFHAGPLPRRLSLADAAGPVMITAIKGTEDDGDDGPDLIVRAVETTGEPAEVALRLPVAGREITATFAPYQLRTFRVPRSPRRRVTEVDLIERPLEDPGVFETKRGTPPPEFTTEGLIMGPDRSGTDERPAAQTQAPAMIKRAT